MDYQQTIEYLYAHLPMFSRIGAVAYKEDLHNTSALCAALGDPQKKFKSIHIAGTNGKGSSSHMLAAVLQQAGYKTGLYTSPHLRDFRERIRINGEMVSEDFVVDFVQRTKMISDEIQPSFFELTVAMAFEYFATQQVDIAVIETGLGGRLDSTNIILPVLSLITNIGFDHMNILGDSLEKIAYEKAGIIKPTTPAVVGEYRNETKDVFQQKAAREKAPLYFAEDRFKVTDIKSTLSHLECVVLDLNDETSKKYSLDLPGLYQAKNLCGVLYAIDILQRQAFNIDALAINQALKNVKQLTGLHGRWELIASDPPIVLDVAHNADGIQQVLNQTDLYLTGDQQSGRKRKLHIVIGMVKDKEVTKVLALLPLKATYYFTNAHIPRALPASELKAKAASFNLSGEIFDDVNVAIQAAKKVTEVDDLILVCGSVFLVGEVNMEEVQ